MSDTPMPLQDRVLLVLAESGPVRVKDIGHWVSGVDPIALDCAMNALMRANKVSRALGSYDLVRPNVETARVVRKVAEPKPSEAAPTIAASLPPTALEEAAASLLPDEPDYEQVCEVCEKPFPIAQFQLVGRGRVRSRVCRLCHGQRSKAGIAKRKLESLKDEPVSPATSLLVSDSSTAEESPSVEPSTHTPPQPPVGSPEPPAISSGRPSEPPAQGTLTAGVAIENLEALSPVGAAGRVDPMESALLRKRARLIQEREQLLEEYERKLKTLMDRIEEIDRVIAEVTRLCSEAA